jgi:hypothetical protein
VGPRDWLTTRLQNMPTIVDMLSLTTVETCAICRVAAVQKEETGEDAILQANGISVQY